MAGDKNQSATAQRKKKAREQGDIVKSRDLTGALGMAAGVLSLGMVSEHLLWQWRESYIRSLDMGSHLDLSLENGAVVNALMRASILPALETMATILAAVLALAVFTGMAQTGGVRFFPESLQMKVDRLNPVTNLKGIFSLRSSARLGKSLVPAALVLFLAARGMEQSVLSLPVLSLDRIPQMFRSQYQLLLAATGVLLGWSALDYLIEWRSWEQKLRMSHEDMREEYKQTEGNPQVRGRIRSIQRQMRSRKLQTDVARATVLIVNPVHYAVALDFDFETMEAPKVLAKGRNLVALKMKEEARWAGVPIVENPPLARSLFRSVEPGHAIPADLYAAVAAILAFLYRQQMEEKMRAADRERQRSQRSTEAHPGVRGSKGQVVPSRPAAPTGAPVSKQAEESADIIDAIWDETESSPSSQTNQNGEDA